MATTSHASWRMVCLISLVGIVGDVTWNAVRDQTDSQSNRRVCTNCDPLIRMVATLGDTTADSDTPVSAVLDESPVAWNSVKDFSNGDSVPAIPESNGTGALLAETQVKKSVVAGIVTLKHGIEVPISDAADQSGRRRPAFSLAPQTRGVPGVVVWIEPEATNRERVESGQLTEGPIEPDGTTPNNLDKTPASRKPNSPAAIIDQRDHEFIPRVVAIRAGDRVKFTNSDQANHNVHGYGFSEKNQFNTFTGNGSSHTQRFELEKKQRPISIGCDIHPWMKAYVFVFEHENFAVTNAEGRFRLPGQLEGRYRLQAWQPDGNFRSSQLITLDTERVPELDIVIDAME